MTPSPIAADEEHPAAEDVRRIIQSAERFHEHPDRDRDQREAVRERGKDLGSPEAEAPLRSRGPRREPSRAERERERCGVAEHVACIREQRQAAGQEPADDLGARVGDGQGKDEPERAPAADPVRVVVRVLHFFGGLIENRPLKSL